MYCVASTGIQAAMRFGRFSLIAIFTDCGKHKTVQTKKMPPFLKGTFRLQTKQVVFKRYSLLLYNRVKISRKKKSTDYSAETGI